MAGARFDVTVDDAAVRQLLAGLVNRAGNIRPALDEIGSALVASTQERFEEEETPEGDRWPALAESTQRKKVTKRNRRGADHILRDRGHLYRSLTHLARRSDVSVGTNRRQAALQHFGGTDDMPPGPAAVPARAFLGLSRDDEAMVADTLFEHLAGAL